jgi:hypothetical protein
MSFLRRIEPFLYSRKNIAGTLLGLAGLGLLFLGITSGVVGLGVVAGLYAIGYLAVPPERGLRWAPLGTQDTREITEELQRLMISLRFRVADDIFNKVGSIARQIAETLPKGGGGIDATDPNLILIRQTALDYLPRALDAYLAVPRIYAERRRIANGRTPHDVLLEQLDLMDQKMHEVSDDIAAHDTERLLAHGRFLQERFADSTLELTHAQVGVGDDPGASKIV